MAKSGSHVVASCFLGFSFHFYIATVFCFSAMKWQRRVDDEHKILLVLSKSFRLSFPLHDWLSVCAGVSPLLCVCVCVLYCAIVFRAHEELCVRAKTLKTFTSLYSVIRALPPSPSPPSPTAFEPRQDEARGCFCIVCLLNVVASLKLACISIWILNAFTALPCCHLQL